jgi:hypothetical protein
MKEEVKEDNELNVVTTEGGEEGEGEKGRRDGEEIRRPRELLCRWMAEGGPQLR